MAEINGIVRGNQYEKLKSYPALNNDTQSFLKGDGNWEKSEITVTANANGLVGTWADGHQAFVIPFSIIPARALTGAQDNAGNLVYRDSSNNVAFTIPLASNE